MIFFIGKFIFLYRINSSERTFLKPKKNDNNKNKENKLAIIWRKSLVKFNNISLSRKDILITQKKTNWEYEFYDYLLKPTEQEPEYLVNQTLQISTAGTEYRTSIISNNMLPWGSALMIKTEDSELKKTGIKNIIHVATGSRKYRDFFICFKSIQRAIQNAIILAERNSQAKIAIPFLGGDYWNAGDDIYSTIDLIVKSALNQRINEKLEIIFVVSAQKKTTKIRWLGLEPMSPLELFQKYLNNYKNKWLTNSEKSRVIEGDITDFSCHQASTIVNHLNMEGNLDGKISQAILDKSSDSQSKMEADIKKIIIEFNKIFSDNK